MTGHAGRLRRIGVAMDLRGGDLPAGAPEDLYEEFDDPAVFHALAEALAPLADEVVLLGNGRALVDRVLADPPDLVFNIAEGAAGRSREALVPGFLELVGVPYTGSDPLTLALTLDKALTKTVVAAAGVPVAGGFAATGPDEVANRDIPLPAVVKPAWEGSSKGLRSNALCRTRREVLERVAEIAGAYHQPALVEEYLPGAEITVGLVGHPPRYLGGLEVVPRRSGDFLYSLEVKRNWRQEVEYRTPPRIAPEALEALEHHARTAWNALGCRDVSRVDFRLDAAGEPRFLEVNPLPGLNPASGDLVILAGKVGLSHGELVRAIAQAAMERCGLVCTCC